MTTKELIGKLKLARHDPYYLRSKEVNEIVKRLEDYDTLTGIIDMCYLGIVKAYTMLRLGEIRDEKKGT